VLDKETAEAVQGQLAAVGIKAKMDGGPVNAMEAKFDAGKSTGMNLWSYGPIYNDSSFLTNIASFSSTALYGPYSHDAKTDSLTQQAVATTDQAERQKLYEQIEDYVLMQNADWVPLYALQDIYGVSDRVVWNARPDQNYAFETATLR
jgi:peptide/nickel transport system substrate-binding protein/oligopeptide transport system substrate-binding protein